MTDPRRVLWQPDEDRIAHSVMGSYLRWLEEVKGLRFADYADLWAWSVTEIEDFWETIWSYFGVHASEGYIEALESRVMPGARWFPGAKLNYAENALARRTEEIAVFARSQTRPDRSLTFKELSDEVGRFAAALESMGVAKGCRVAAILPNCPEAVIAFLATASLGAIWSSCAPEFGVRSIVDRFRQIEPTVLLAVDGYRYGAKTFDRVAEVAQIRAALPGLRDTVILSYLDRPLEERFPGCRSWEEIRSAHEPRPPEFVQVPFDHPLWVVYSSGTTGLPKPIIHGHGGMLIEQLRQLGLQHDLTADDRFFWSTTTGWVMWNTLVGGLLHGAGIVLFDGDVGYPDLTALWRLAADAQVTQFGAGAAFYVRCMKEGVSPGSISGLSQIRGLGSTGSPLPDRAFEWVYSELGPDLMLGSTSGGTDIASGFVGPSPLLPVRVGEIQCRYLGAKVEAFDGTGQSLVGTKGELVITEPLPSMPLGFWGDPEGTRLHESYFDVYPGVWRHGDWIVITDCGSCVISGRSDATLKRGGVRMGTGEFYAVVEGFAEIADSLVVEVAGSEETEQTTLLLFLEMAPDRALDDDLVHRLRSAIRADLSPRHVPDRIVATPEVPRTLTNKKMEIPVRRLLSGEPASDVASPDAMANPTALDFFLSFRESL